MEKSFPYCTYLIIMKHIVFLFLLINLCSISSQAQTLFNKNYQNSNGSGNWISTSMIFAENHYYIIGGYTTVLEESSETRRGVCILEIDNLGEIEEIQYHVEQGRDIFEGWNHCLIITENGIGTTGGIFTDTTIGGFFTEYNFDLDTIISKELFLDTISDRCFGLFKTTNGYIFAGSIDSSRNAFEFPETVYNKIHLFKTDFSGNHIWSKTFSFGSLSDGCWSSGSQLVQAKDSGYVIIGTTSDFGQYRNFILKTDSLGNQQWVRFYGNSSYDNPGFSDIIATKDSCYIVCGAYTYGETGGGYYPYDSWILKIDNDGNTKWDRKHRDSIVYDVIANHYYGFYRGVVEKDNGDLLTVCNTYSDEDSVFIGQGFRIRCLDSLGNRKWDKVITRVGNQGGPLWPQSIQLTDDNGIAVGGWAEIYYFNELEQWVSDQRIFLVKTDSLGNDTLLSDISPYEAKPITNFDLICYPNPANNEFFVDLPQGAEDDVLEIYYTNGALVHEQAVGVFNNRVDICNLKPGMYLVKLRGKELYCKLIVE